MDQTSWFNPSAPAPQNERQAFEAGWAAAQKQMACSQPTISEQIFQHQSVATSPRPSYLPGRLIRNADEVRASEIPMDGTVAVFPSSDYSYVVLKAWNSNGSIQTEYYKHVNPNETNEPTKEDDSFEEFKMGLNERLERIEKMLMSTQNTKNIKEVTSNEQPSSSIGSNGYEPHRFGPANAE